MRSRNCKMGLGRGGGQISQSQMLQPKLRILVGQFQGRVWLAGLEDIAVRGHSRS